MRITKPKIEKEVKEKKVRVESKTNFAPVTSPEAVSIRTTSAEISTPVEFGSIGRASFITSFTNAFKAAFDVPGQIEFGKKDAEVIFGILKDTANDAVKTAHVQRIEKNLSSILVYTPLNTLKVTAKANRSARNPSLLRDITAVKNDLLAQGATIEQIEIHPDYVALTEKWVASETVSDNDGKSAVRMKEFAIAADGTTPTDAARQNVLDNAAKKA